MSTPHQVVARQLAAYNSHDIEAFCATYAEDAVVHRRDGSTLNGRKALRDTYAELFAKGRCRAVVTGRLTQGDWVVDHEEAHGLSEEPVRVLVAYRVRHGRIDRVDFLG
ncbi:nuclear transport factor 2 family protein [Streptomyces sp. NPDC059070]|uniref:nuclear transport factor 2 family protein n=1 Tax=Streptomyces sp. NPDC059070 TaxID=3346713 RepID=UPI0036B54B26